ncbi:MAG TPA: restriction endonuclease subunit S [Candidatus Riflebacteria bacterium]|jgi:type I restriction enzyme S subunit|nr:restriction endonuclease subunit S [Candidatus Riflebacteria bacterium]
MTEPLPNGWKLFKLEQLGAWGTGGTPTRKRPDFFQGSIPWIKTGELVHKYIYDTSEKITEDAVKNSNAKIFPANSIAIAMYGATIGKVSILAVPASTNQACAVLTPDQRFFSPEFVYYLLCNAKNSLINLAKGGAQPNISQTIVKGISVAIPPLLEQKRIVARLDRLLARVDSCRAHLDRAATAIKRFRQSVLNAAVTGQLSEYFRKSSEYDNVELGWQIPDGWQLLSVEDVVDVKGGKRLPNGEKLISEVTKYPYIRAGQLKNGSVNTEGQLYLTEEAHSQISNYTVSSGDVYITIVGACIGDAGIIPDIYNGANLTENAAKLCNFKKPLKSEFLSYWLRSQYLQDTIQQEIKSGAQGKLALKRIRSLPMPMPSLNEQNEIVQKVCSLFAFSDQIESKLTAARQRADNLTASILAKAFRGELVATPISDSGGN